MALGDVCVHCQKLRAMRPRVTGVAGLPNALCDEHFSLGIAAAIKNTRGRVPEATMELDLSSDVHVQMLDAIGVGEHDEVMRLYRQVTDLNILRAVKDLEGLDDDLDDDPE